MQKFEAVFRWPIRLLNRVGNQVLRWCGLEPASGHEMVHSVDELRLLVTGMQQAGVVDQVESRITSRATYPMPRRTLITTVVVPFREHPGITEQWTGRLGAVAFRSCLLRSLARSCHVASGEVNPVALDWTVLP
jgi:hypothetical protein